MERAANFPTKGEQKLRLFQPKKSIPSTTTTPPDQPIPTTLKSLVNNHIKVDRFKSQNVMSQVSDQKSLHPTKGFFIKTQGTVKLRDSPSPNAKRSTVETLSQSKINSPETKASSSIEKPNRVVVTKRRESGSTQQSPVIRPR